ncbi:SPOR domain-containing protein [Aliidiomarina sanyensis]|uniref:SPOR domain-containing protein n=1 Tax=Aliidiomarina sanyensis TaxID=1249555 RepID=UPI00130036D5|nr:SPOR domain-containing protein [Aliidiomarina sanyensis]
MGSPLKNRIVGTLIVGAIAIIVLPDLLSGKNYTPEEEFQVTPLRPEVALELRGAEFPPDFSEQATRVPEPFEGDVQDDAPALEMREAQLTPAARPANQSSTASSSAQEAITGDAFAIQLGAFRNADTVADLVRQLQAQGFQAYSRTTQNSAGQSLTLLMVGPDLNQQRLNDMLPQLKELTNLEGRVVAYSPTR